jgi:hypothetical protein
MRIKARRGAAIEAADGRAAGLEIAGGQYGKSQAGGNPPEEPPAVEGLNLVRGSGDEEVV